VLEFLHCLWLSCFQANIWVLPLNSSTSTLFCIVYSSYSLYSIHSIIFSELLIPTLNKLQISNKLIICYWDHKDNMFHCTLHNNVWWRDVCHYKSVSGLQTKTTKWSTLSKSCSDQITQKLTIKCANPYINNEIYALVLTKYDEMWVLNAKIVCLCKWSSYFLVTFLIIHSKPACVHICWCMYLITHHYCHRLLMFFKTGSWWPSWSEGI
jgi:hypothetical protein